MPHPPISSLASSILPHRGPRRAYTLVEMLIVITMLGIASALVIPSIASTDVLRVQATVRTIVADLAFAQSDALARQQGRAFIFDVVTNRYSIVEVRGSTLQPATDTISTTDLTDSRRYHDSRIISADFDGDHILVFDEMGAPIAAPGSSTPGNGGVITISGSGAVYEIRVEPYTGRVSVVRISD